MSVREYEKKANSKPSIPQSVLQNRGYDEVWVRLCTWERQLHQAEPWQFPFPSSEYRLSTMKWENSAMLATSLSGSADLQSQMDHAATRVVELLKAASSEFHTQKVVFAESCTAGLIAATLGRIPGVSDFLAGSTVVYQVETKACWLGADRGLLANPGPVSEVIATQMATGVLQMTPHADVSLSITGHLGPGAPAGLDGVVWLGIAKRVPDGEERLPERISTRLIQLTELSVSVSDGAALRQLRQQAAVVEALTFLAENL
ncbi:MAG: CinA family protein [Planctomycetaceae bacterium]